MLQCALEYHEMLAVKKELHQAYLVSEAIIKGYNQCIAANVIYCLSI